MLSVRTVYILRLLHLVVLSPLLTKMVNRQFRRSTYCGYIRQEAAPAQRCVFGAGQSLRPSRRVASYSRLILDSCSKRADLLGNRIVTPKVAGIVRDTRQVRVAEGDRG